MPSDLATDLSRAIAGDEIVPHFQPLVELRAGRLSGFAVLARWHHKTRGIIDPSVFIPLAEQTGLIGELTDHLVCRAVSAAAPWPNHLTLSVNLSPALLHDRALAQRLRAASDGTGFSFDRLVFEVTEATLISHPDVTRVVAGALQALGASLELGDLGAGYAKLPQFVALRFDRLKVGARFVHTMLARRESRRIVAAVIGLGRTLGMTSVATGVETKADADMLIRLGCDIAQGGRFGEPMPAETVATRLSAADAPWHPPGARAPMAADATPRLAALQSRSPGHVLALFDNAPADWAWSMRTCAIWRSTGAWPRCTARRSPIIWGGRSPRWCRTSTANSHRAWRARCAGSRSPASRSAGRARAARSTST
jgi:EAL domain-containing protein (putative c-di-GMP-specific phosphodiesterase class I)